MEKWSQKKKQQLIELGKNVDKKWLKQELDWCCQKLKLEMQRFGNQFPSACAENGQFRIKKNDDWTNGFWTGMLWLAYEYTQEQSFKQLAEKNLESFQQRLADHFVLEHHDIGFLYSLSAYAGYRLTEKESYKEMTIQAADVLLARYQEKGGFIQAWGSLTDKKEYRLIIDSLLNLPLLHQAFSLTKNEKYQQVAEQHFQQVTNTIIREDFSTYHTYYFDIATGKPAFGATHQGFSDQSTWARGQAWAVLGIPIAKANQQTLSEELPYQKITQYFLEKLPEDFVPYWDLSFTEKDQQSKDSSAASIFCCGLLEAEKEQLYPQANQLAKGLVYQLGSKYTTKELKDSEGLLAHGVYAYAEGKGIDQPNLWGDYFYMEALYRSYREDWQSYWEV